MADKTKSAKPSIFTRLGKYFRDTWGEFKKIVWPSRKTVIKNCLVVLVLCVAFGVVVWGIDYLLATLRDLLINAF